MPGKINTFLNRIFKMSSAGGGFIKKKKKSKLFHKLRPATQTARSPLNVIRVCGKS